MAEFLELGTDPIPGQEPGGFNARNEGAFLELQAEIAKLSVASAEMHEVDWQKVVELSRDILATQSKDLLAAVYLCAALIKTREMEGLSQGTRLLADLLENFWDSLFPPLKRMRGRLNAIQWWFDQVEKYLDTYQGPEIPWEIARTIRDLLLRLDEQIAGRFEDGPILRRLVSAFDALPQQAPPEPEPEAPAEPPPSGTDSQTAPADSAVAAPAASASAAPASEPASPAAAPASPAPAAVAVPQGEALSIDDLLREAGDSLLALAEQAFAADPAHAMSYRLRRIVAWSGLQTPPVASEGRTRIPDPESEVVESLQHLLASGAGLELVQAAEARVSQHLFWIDLSFMTARGLESMGSQYQAAARAVALDALAFVERMPGLPGLSFADGLPMVSQAARMWLQQVGGAAGPGGESGNEQQETVLREASKRAHDKGPVAGLTLLQDSLQQCPAGKDRFLLRSGMLSILAAGGRGDLAIPLSREIMQEVEQRQLHTWDPQLALRGLTSAWVALGGSSEEEAVLLAKQVFARITALDPAVALALLQGI